MLLVVACFAQAFQIAKLVFQFRIGRPFPDVMDDGSRYFLSIAIAFHAKKFVAAKGFPAHRAPSLTVVEVVFHMHLKANKNAPNFSAGAYLYDFSIVMISQVRYDIPRRHGLFFKIENIFKFFIEGNTNQQSQFCAGAEL